MLSFNNFDYDNETGHPYDDFDPDDTVEHEFFIRGYNFVFHDKRFYIEDGIYDSIIWCSNGSAAVPLIDIRSYTHFVRSGGAAYIGLQQIDKVLDTVTAFGIDKLCEAVDFLDMHTIYREVIENDTQAAY